MQLRPSFKVAIYLFLLVLITLVSVQLVWKVPKPFILSLAVLFVLSSLVFGVVYRSAHRIVFRRVALLVIAWLASAAIIFIGIRLIDRAGWLWFVVTGYDVAVKETHSVDLLPSPRDLAARYPFLAMDEVDAGTLVIKKGRYDIDETVVIPAQSKLVIEPGVTLRFASGRSLISYSAIIARGSQAQPIRFEAMTPLLKWGGVAIISAGKSNFEYVQFENARYTQVNDVECSAGLSILESDVEIRHCRFVNMYGKDAVNVRYGEVLIRNCYFENAFKDGLDLDGGTGEVSGNEFINCQDEGIDLSEHFNIRVFGNKILDKRGGRIGAEINFEEIVSANTLGYLENKQ